jgi:hypothetical protein
VLSRFNGMYYGFDSLRISVFSPVPRSFCGPGFVWAYYGDFGEIAFYGQGYDIGAVCYDTNTVRHARLFPDTIRFYCHSGDSLTEPFDAYTDALDRYRAFEILESVALPFEIQDSVPLSYQCISFLSYCKFHPTKPGHYIDTALILDPLTNDTIPLVLIGDAYDASVSEEAAQPLKLYPNPCDRTLTLELPDDQPAEIEIRNLLGETVFSRLLRNEESIDCSGLAEGDYFAWVSCNGTLSTRKLIVAH